MSHTKKNNNHNSVTIAVIIVQLFNATVNKYYIKTFAWTICPLIPRLDCRIKFPSRVSISLIATRVTATV